MAVEATTVEIDVYGLTHDGQGIADVQGKRVFIAGALPGERVRVEYRKRRRRFYEAKLLDVIDSAGERVEPGCEYFGRCGGCAIQHLARPAQIRFKSQIVRDAFERIAAVEPEVWLEPVSGEQWNYRRRARLGVKYVDGKGRALVGFRERAAPYITDMNHCSVLAAPLDKALAELSEVIAATSIFRRIPQIEAAVGDERGALVFRVLDPPNQADTDALVALGERLGLDIYLQSGGPGTVRPVTANPARLFYDLQAHGVRLHFEPTDFIQVNAQINAIMVAEAIELAEVAPDDRVLDLFCGIGNFSLPFAKRAGELLGVEGEAGLVARAAGNAQSNEIANARFLTADLAAEGWSFMRENWDIVVLDPPRTGAEAVVGSLASTGARRVVYVSCHPATLARDAKALTDTGRYRLTSVRAFDMFPHTHHVEAMAVFDAV